MTFKDKLINCSVLKETLQSKATCKLKTQKTRQTWDILGTVNHGVWTFLYYGTANTLQNNSSIWPELLRIEQVLNVCF